MSEIKQSHITDSEIKVKCEIIVVSDSLSKLGEDWKIKDKSGNIALEFFLSKNIEVNNLSVVEDSIELIRMKVNSIIKKQPEVNLIVTIGGTGISKRDITIEALRPLLDKELPGFGEIFRLETYKELKTVAIMSRAIAGVKDHIIICCLPGSSNAVKLGLSILEPEILHILNLRLKK